MNSDTKLIGSIPDIDIDETLNVEGQYYREGVESGLAQGAADQYRDGLQYGYQTGYQRFLVVGYCKGLWEWWSYKYGDDKEHERIKCHLNQLETYLKEIDNSNDEAVVEKYEKTVIKIRNKIRVIATVLKEPQLAKAIDDVIAIGGQVHLNENPDDMW
ncbi:uncharacterized protein KQ657_001928 [Scheffersomyces spartinae]|uniref:Essential protein Yae1 N-terminal domain-containing protein n=1 Tax=Scheffersomyces spartinae TaxID=45513 RepID=A0A9P7V6P4_9ASCO|nr:uncharacterized protein KQ657_001928 [Scheffersomyces spartinae]KAG7192210.1 hypothetical protein KQ657_001928 [Scheffersomyces spartinae]